MNNSFNPNLGFDLPKILWLEDDKLYVSLIKDDFEQKYDLDNISTCDEIKKINLKDISTYHAIIIDMELQNGYQGIDVIKYLKNNGVQVPIVVLSNNESVQTKIEALGLGVDDYLWKAMEPEEMVLRLENAVRRGHKSLLNYKINFGLVEIEPARLLVKIKNEELSFSKIEFHLLLSLIQSHPEPLTCEYLKKEIWRQPKVEVGTINTFIWKMNKKLNSWDFRITKELENIFIIKKSSDE